MKAMKHGSWYWRLKCFRPSRPKAIGWCLGNTKEMYKKRNQLERSLRCLKGFRRIFSRLEKLDVVFMFFVHFALVSGAIVSVNRP